jgi:hypothetical protein
MPWTKEDVKKHNKDLTPEQEKVWLKVANKERETCIAKGGTEETCDAKAIRIANKVVSGMKENEWMGAEYQKWLGESLKERIMDKLKSLVRKLKEAVTFNCECIKCGYKETSESHCADLKCSKCGGQMRRAERPGPGQESREAAIVNLIESAESITDKSSDEEINGEITKISEFLKSVPVESEMLIETETIPIDEGAIKEVNVPIKIIQPGWGSSGYYSKKLLENSASKYRAGTLMFWDHPTESEEKERPERSLRDVAGVLISDGTFKEDGKAGPGIYALAKPFPEFRTNIEAMGKYIGISHRARGLREQGEAEGKKGPVIKNITEVASVDFVTVPGAGGQVVSLFESAKNGGAQENINKQEVEMDEKLKEVQDQLKTKETELAEAQKAKDEAEKKLKESDEKLAEVAQKEMAEQVSAITKTVLAEVKDLPEAAKSRIKVSPVIKEDGALDEDKVKEAINEQVIAERNYLAELKKTGTVKEMGETVPAKSKDSLKESFKAKYIREGKSEAEAERLAAIAAR